MTKESDEFERVTRVILHNLRQHLGYEKIEGSKRYKGKSSGRKRQIDATVYRTDGKMIIVECKRHKRKVGIKSIGEFYYVINREVGAGGGLIVSSVGFDAGAQAVANAANKILCDSQSRIPTRFEGIYTLRTIYFHNSCTRSC